MAVRVRLRLRCGERELTIVALVNGGAESEEPVVVMTLAMANQLGISLSDMEIIEVELAGGVTRNLISKDKVEVELLDELGKNHHQHTPTLLLMKT